MFDKDSKSIPMYSKLDGAVSIHYLILHLPLVDKSSHLHLGRMCKSVGTRLLLLEPKLVKKLHHDLLSLSRDSIGTTSSQQ
jgi:hypothetical protein